MPLLNFVAFADMVRMDEHRAEVRAAVMVRVEASWQDESGTQHKVLATLEDTSRSGVSIRISEPIPVGLRLEIKTHWEQFSGVVTHCHLYRREFLVGLHRLTENRVAPPAE